MSNLLPLLIKTDFFKKVEQRNENLKAKDIDSQFNIITNYINNSLVSALNQLIGQTLPGSLDPTKIGANLINVGDGNTKWDFPNHDFLTENSLELNKLKQLNIGSIIVTDENSQFKDIAPTSYGLSLISRLNKNPIWAKISNSSIANRSITSVKIAKNTLTKEKFSFNVARKYIKKIIKNVVIKENSIDGDKIRIANIKLIHLDAELIAKLLSFTPASSLLDESLIIEDKTDLDSSMNIKIVENSINYKKISANFKIPADAIIAHETFIADGALTARNFDNQSVFLYPIKIFNGAKYYGSTIKNQNLANNFAQYFEKNSIGTKQLPIAYQQKLGFL